MPGIIQISSRDNARLKDARRVRDGKQRDKIFIEGVRLVEEAVRSGLSLESLFVSNEGMARASELVHAAAQAETYQLGDSVFESISDTVTSQGIVAIAPRPAARRGEVENGLSSATVPIVLFLHQTNNPSNLGAVIRTAEAAGVAGVIVSSGSADVFAPKALRSAMGSSFRLPIWTDAEITEVLEWAARHDLRTVATDINATTSYAEVDWKRPSIILLGSEAHGLSKAGLRDIDEKILIAMEKSVDSLNLAVATGVILFEARRQNLLAG